MKKIWVQIISKAEQAFKIDYIDGMDVSELKEGITLKRKTLNYSPAVITFIHATNSDNSYLSADFEIPMPTTGERGSSETMPYFFSLATNQQQLRAGNLLLPVY